MTAHGRAAKAPLKFVVVSHDITSNALGRAISMVLVAREIGPTHLFAFGTGSQWKGSSQFDVPVARLSKNWKTQLLRELKSGSGSRNVVWLSKGIAPLHQVAKYVSEVDPEAVILLDLDDDDAGLADSFAKTSFLNRLRLHPFRRGNATQIRRSQMQISNYASGFTFSSNALSTIFPETFVPKVRIPHVRKDTPSTGFDPTRPRSGVRFGSFGTLRPHKGSGLLLELMRQDRTLTLVTFSDCGLGKPEASDSNWIEIPSNTPLADAYSLVDVSLIPITEKNTGAQFQLPAKLIDSLQAGVSVLASSTPAIEEIAGGVYATLDSTNDTRVISRQIKDLGRQNEGQKGRERFLEVLTPYAAAKELTTLLASSSHVEESL